MQRQQPRRILGFRSQVDSTDSAHFFAAAFLLISVHREDSVDPTRLQKPVLIFQLFRHFWGASGYGNDFARSELSLPVAL